MTKEIGENFMPSPAKLALAEGAYNQKQIIETTGTSPDTTTYVGVAPRGSGTDEAVWKVKRVAVTDSGNTTTITWSDQGQVWDDRATLTYS